MTEPSSSPAGRSVLREAERLLEPDRRLGIPLPAYGGRSLANLPSTLWTGLAGEKAEPLPLPPLERGVDPFPEGRPDGPVVVLLVDGLGWTALQESASRLPGGVAARWVPHSRPLTSVFPTTTTVALTSLSTGAAPGQHGIVGHRVYLSEFGSVVEILRMSPLGVAAAEALVGPTWSPSILSNIPSVFRRGLPGVALSRDRFEGTGFTRLIYDGARFVGYSTGSDLAVALAELLSRRDPPPLVFAYSDELDNAEHVRGPCPALVDLELDRMGVILSYVARAVGPAVARGTTLLVTGDHGQVPMEDDHQLAVDREPSLLAHLSRPPAGDRRATYFAARPGHLASLREELEARCPDGGHLLDVPASVDAGLYGPPPFHPDLADRLGDLLLLLPSPGGVSYSLPGARPRTHPMRGAHGGAEPAELLVPLVSGSLSELVAPSSGTIHLPRAPSTGERT